MSDFNQSWLSLLSDGKKYNETVIGTVISNSSCNSADCTSDKLGMFLMITFTFLICLFGFVGNGIVIWLLVFHIKRNNFTTYILNLCIADFGVLVVILAIDINWVVCQMNSYYFGYLRSLFYTVFLFTYSTSQFLLTVISIERSVSVFFPMWYRFHKPKHLSITVCAVIWILAFLVSGIHITLWLIIGYCHIKTFQFVANALLCTPLMIISTITLFRKVSLKPQQRKRGKLLTAILFALLFFVLFAFPMNVVQVIALYFKDPYLLEYAFICASLNSTVNPVIYFLVGAQNCQVRDRIANILENVLKEDQHSKDELQPSVKTSSYDASIGALAV